MAQKRLRRSYAQEYGLDTALLKRVIECLHRECGHEARECGEMLQHKDLAFSIYPRKGRNAPVAWSQFKRKLDGRPSLAEIDQVFGGYRKVLHSVVRKQHRDTSPEVAVAEIEENILRRFGLEARGSRLSASMFVTRGSSDPDDRTLALRHHDLVGMRRECAELRRWTDTLTGDVFAKVCEHIGAQPVRSRPPSANPSRFHVVTDSVVFDCTDWRPVDEKEVQTRPIQPCYVTRVVTVSLKDSRTRTIAFEGNTSGFGIIPALVQIDLPSRFLVQSSARMAESERPVRTFYREVDVPSGPAGRLVTIVMRSIVFNGLQQARNARGGDRSTKEWFGKRVLPETESADLTVILPLVPRHNRWQFVRRPESVRRDIVEKPDKRERKLEPAEHDDAPIKEGVKAIWKFPRVEETTVFSFRWSWAED